MNGSFYANISWKREIVHCHVYRRIPHLKHWSLLYSSGGVWYSSDCQQLLCCYITVVQLVTVPFVLRSCRKTEDIPSGKTNIAIEHGHL